MAVKTSQTHSYQDFVHALKSVVGAKTPTEFPRLVVITGSSNFLHMKACHAVKVAWEALGVGEGQSIEASDLDQSKFMSLWSQVSLFEPDALYIIRRAGGIKGLGSWLAGIKTPEAIKSHIVIDCADKLLADVLKQITRLKAVVIHGTEPTAMVEFQKVAHGLARRAGVDLDDDALRLLIESMGMDLGKVENEIVNLSLRFAGRKERLTRADIAGSIGSLREDDVFELFSLLRDKRQATAHMMAGNFLTRGESAIAITGIFARYAREQIERGSLKRGLAGLKACAEADRTLKSSRIDEGIVLSGIIDRMSEA